MRELVSIVVSASPNYSMLKQRIFMFLLFVALGSFALFANGQTSQSFQGTWRWAIYAKSRDELPNAYRNYDLRDVPAAAIQLIIKQRGNKLTGEYSGSRRFLARLEEGEFDGLIKGNVTKLDLQSGFNGTVTVRLTLQENRLHWKMIKSEGTHYFPDDVYLTRVVRRKKRR